METSIPVDFPCWMCHKLFMGEKKGIAGESEPCEDSHKPFIMEVVCAVMLNAQDEILVCQRPEGKMLAGKWEFPGGKVEPGETYEEALYREMDEELDCEIDIVDELKPVLHDYGTFVIRLRPFVCRLLNGEPKPIEHAAIRWIGGNSLHSIDLAEADREIVCQIREGL